MSEQDISRSLELCKRVVTTESFIAEAKEIYGGRYDYSKVEYKNKEHRVTVVCPIHGDFQVYAREHLDGKGCPKCAKGEKFLLMLKEKFGDKFGLDEYVYESSTTPVTLICPTHGSFSRLPHQILNAPLGCPECGKALQNLHREQARLDAIEHKEERDQARRERYYARKEAERLREEEAKHAEEVLAKEKWNDKIKEILCQREIETPSKFDLFNGAPGNAWYKDFFGFNLNHLCLDDGTPVDGKQLVFLRPRHWPLQEMRVEAYDGELVKVTFYLCDLKKDKLYELLLILENILSCGCKSMDDVKEKYESRINHVFSFDGVQNGYKIVFNQWTLLNVTITIKKIGAWSQRFRTYPTYDIKYLPNSFVGIDFETLYPQRVSACSVGMVKYINGVAVDRFYSLIRPPFDYPGKCGKVLTWIHGLTEDMVKDEKTFDELLPEMEHFVDGLPLVAHNACVERACIRDACDYYGVETKLDFENIFDTLALSKQAEAKLGIKEEGPGTHQLDTVCKRFGIEGNNHHNALADAEMSGNLMVLFQKLLNGNDTIEVAETKVAPKQKYNPEDKVQRADLENIKDNPFKNQVVVLTGFSKNDSQEYAHKLNNLGAIVRDGVNKKTSILITGYNAGPSKMKKAQELGVRIMPEEEFKKTLEQL